jgi:hypothetical protein
MAYIGNTAEQQAFTPAIDYFNGNGSTVAFTLSRPVASVAQVQAVIENVPQNPGDAYTVSGNTITFTSAPPSGTSNIYVYYTSPITTVATLSQDPVITGSMTFGSTGARIRGDFSNATLANQVLFQTSTANNSTQLRAIPNGTGTQTGVFLYDSSDTLNNAWGAIRAINTADVRIQSGITGTGSYLPLTMYTGGSERMRIDTSGNVGIGTSSPNAKLDVLGGGLTSSSIAITNNDNATISANYSLVFQADRNNNIGGRSFDWKFGGKGYSDGTLQMYLTQAGNLAFNSGYGSAAVAYGCRAWVNFNNTGTPSIRASGNVSSITDNGAGIFTVNFATAMPNTNYCVSSWVRSDATAESVFGYCTAYSNGTKTTSAMQFLQGVQQNGTTYSSAESSEVGLTFFR